MIDFDLSFWDHLVVVIFGVILPFLAIINAPSDPEPKEMDTATKLQMYYSNGGFLWVMMIVVIIVWVANGRPFIELGFSAPKINGSVVFLIIIFLLLLFLDFYFKVRPEQIHATRERFKKYIPFSPINYREYKHFTFLAFAAGVCEEIVFRAYFILYFASLFYFYDYAIWLAIVIPSVIFGLSHLYQGWNAAMKVILMGIIFGLLYVISESIWLIMILHFIIDMLAGWAGIWYMNKREG